MTLHIVTGAPCSGKSTYVREHAAPDDVRIDFDAMATALGSSTPHGSKGRVRGATFAARKAAIYWLLANDAPDADSWIIHSSPADWQKAAYADAGAEFIEMTADLDTCLARAEADGRPEGEADKIRAWFEGKKAATALYKSADLAMVTDGTVEGYFATYDREPDSYGDVIAPGAFTRTIAEWREKMARGLYIPLLYGHDTSDPKYNIGRVTSITDDERGPHIVAEFDGDNEVAQKVRRLVAQGRLYQFSFAYAVRDSGPVDIGGFNANELRDLDLYEVSLVQIPANQHAEVTGIKADATNAVVDGDRITIDGDSIKVGTVSVAVNLDSIKSGRRNSAKDADELRAIADHAREIITAIAALLEEGRGGDEDEPKGADGAGSAAADRDAKKAAALAYIEKMNR